MFKNKFFQLFKKSLLLRDRQTWLSYVIGLNKSDPTVETQMETYQSTSPTPTPGRAIKIQPRNVELHPDVFTI